MISSTSADSRSSVEQILDLPQLLDRCMGQLAFADMCLTRFQQQLQADVEQLQQFGNAGNTVEVARLAHLIRGSACTIAATALASRAAALESAARRAPTDDTQLSSATHDLMDEVQRFIEAVPSFHLGS